MQKKKNVSNIGQIYLITMQRTKNSEIMIFGLYFFSYIFFSANIWYVYHMHITLTLKKLIQMKLILFV